MASIEQSNTVEPTTIIVPVYNGARFLATTLESVFAQTREDWRLIVVDDGSTDLTAQVATHCFRHDPRVRLVRKPHGGLPSARNRGFTEVDSACRSVLFLDADDQLNPNALTILTRALASQPTAPAAYGVARYIDAEGGLWRPGEAESKSRTRQGIVGSRLTDWNSTLPTTFAMLAYHCVIFTSGQALIRREAMHRAGGYDETLSGSADWDMWLRLSRQSDLIFVDRLVLSYRRHGNNMSGNFRLMRTDEIRVRRKLILSAENSAEQRRIAKVSWRAKERFNGSTYLGLAIQALRNRRALHAVKWLGHSAEGYLHWLFGATSLSWVDLWRHRQSPVIENRLIETRSD